MELSVIIYGDEYSLTDGTYCYWISHDGLGMSPLHRITERGPLQHGDTDRGYRLDPRIVNLVFTIVGLNSADLEAKRLTLMNFFNPAIPLITLKFVDNIGTYYLDCKYLSDMTMPSNDKSGFSQNVVVTVKANDPTFYDPESEYHVYFSIYGADTSAIPMPVPSFVGTAASTVLITEEVFNEGTVAAYPTIRLTGPVEDPVITNNTTGEKLDFTGTHIAAADYFEIDLRYGYKTVVDSAGANKIDKLTSDSDLVSWHLADAFETIDGLNSITIYGGGLSGVSQFGLVWNNRYIGI